MQKQTKKTVNQVKRAYTYYLERKIKQLYGMKVNDEVSVQAMQKNISNYVFNAATYYVDKQGVRHDMKKVEFLENIKNMTNKQSIYYYCINSVKKARRTKTR